MINRYSCVSRRRTRVIASLTLTSVCSITIQGRVVSSPLPEKSGTTVETARCRHTVFLNGSSDTASESSLDNAISLLQTWHSTQFSVGTVACQGDASPCVLRPCLLRLLVSHVQLSTVKASQSLQLFLTFCLDFPTYRLCPEAAHNLIFNVVRGSFAEIHSTSTICVISEEVRHTARCRSKKKSFPLRFL